jgi:nitric oxide reductase NorQ protein
MQDVRCEDEMTPLGTARTERADVNTPRATQSGGAGIWQCPICGYKAKNQFGLRIHIGMMHKDVASKVFANMPLVKAFNHFAQSTSTTSYVPKGIIYDDWCNYLPILERAYKNKLFVLIIGPKGTGKTTLVRKFAENVGKTLYSINFSLRTKETHLVGTMMLENGTTKFAMGLIPKSMQEGAILYLDELNAAEPDVLLRLDEALDDRRELILKEAGEIITVKAKEDWFVVATINPLSHAGTKELPPQLLSRFPVRLYLDYPPPDIEKKIVKMYVNDGVDGELDKAIRLANKLREAAKVEDVYYSPSIRETIAYAKMVESGVDPKLAAEVVFANVYSQWGELEVQKVKDLIASIWGEKQ